MEIDKFGQYKCRVYPPSLHPPPKIVIRRRIDKRNMLRQERGGGLIKNLIIDR